MTSMRLAGIDLAWNGDSNPSAIAVGLICERQLVLESLEPQMVGLNSIIDFLSTQNEINGIAIDAPLIINNEVGQRPCEASLNRDYRVKKAGCHPSNKSLYPDAFSVRLSSELTAQGFVHLGETRWQIECYPHPTLIECFNLSERLLYKKGSVEDKRNGQIELAGFISQLADSDVLALKIPAKFQCHLSTEYIQQLKGRALKSNEDALDAMICLYIAGLYQRQVDSTTYGDAQDGYVWVPQVTCI